MFTHDTSKFDCQAVDHQVVFTCFRHQIWKSWIPNFRLTVFSDFGTPTFGHIFYCQVPCSPFANVSNTTMKTVFLVPFLFSSRRGLAKKGGYLLGNATPHLHPWM